MAAEPLPEQPSWNPADYAVGKRTEPSHDNSPYVPPTSIPVRDAAARAYRISLLHARGIVIGDAGAMIKGIANDHATHGPALDGEPPAATP